MNILFLPNSMYSILHTVKLSVVVHVCEQQESEDTEPAEWRPRAWTEKNGSDERSIHAGWSNK